MSAGRVHLSLPIEVLGSVLVHLAENYETTLSADDGTLVVEVNQ